MTEDVFTLHTAYCTDVPLTIPVDIRSVSMSLCVIVNQPPKEGKMTKKLTIAGETFAVQDPYAPGHTLNEAEAKVLNQTRSENVGNNMRETIKEAKEKGLSFDQMQGLVNEYDDQYNFSMGGSTRIVVDPLEREARKYAKEQIKLWLNSDAGGHRKLKEIPEADLENEIQRLIDEDPVVMAEAKKRLKANQKKAQVAGIQLGLPAQPAAQ